MKRLTKKNVRLGLTGLGLTLVLFLSACEMNNDPHATSSNDGLTPVNIGFPSAGGNWPFGTLGVAYEFGYLAHYLEPLGFTPHVTGFVGAAPALHEALISSDLDLVNYAGFASILGRARGIDTTLLAISDYRAPWSLIVSVESGIQSLADLAGSRIAYQSGASPHMYLLRVLDEAGLAFEEVTGFNMSIPDGLAAITTGSIDAAVISTGQATDLIENAYVQVLHAGFASDPTVFFEPSVSIGRTTFVDNHPEVVVAYLQALLAARERIAADPQAYYALFSERSGNHIDVITSIASDDKVVSYPLNLDAHHLETLRTIQAFQLEHGIIEHEFSIDAWQNEAFINQAIEEHARER
ncbi:MAG: ABC transporter substrate-binding protein [Defluviitaleaceae bacterium]|nr:ABC transporter substrate-binding protein [Defluviitaleaceae bacterium]